MAEATYDQPVKESDSEGEEDRDALIAQLEALANTLAKYRREAITGRYVSGVENIWREDQEFYEGIDDANRHEMGTYRSKPPGQPYLGDENDDDNTSSTVFPNITRPYVNAMAARVGDMLLPTDEHAWQIKETPIPELIELKDIMPTDASINEIRERHADMPDGEEKESAVVVDMGDYVRNKLPKEVQRDFETEVAARDDYNQADDATRNQAMAGAYVEFAESIQEDLKKARKAAQAAETQINDWHVESQYTTEMRKVIEATSRIGTGVIKGPIPMASRKVAYKDGKLIMVDDVKPQSFQTDVWNCFPDPGCGESIHNGQYHWEKDNISKKSLASLANEPDYIPEMISVVMSEGAHQASREVTESQEMDELVGLTRRDKKHLFELWYGYVYLTREEAEEVKVDIPEDFPDYGMIPVEVTMVNNHIIKAILNPLDSGEFPYDYMVMDRMIGMPYGIGVARQLRVPQRIYTAALRNMMDNAGLAGGPMWTYLHGIVEPMDGKYELAPRKGWMVNLDKIKEPRLIEWAFRFIDMDMKQEQLQAIMDSALKMAEDITGMPMIMQGQQGSAPDTVGGMNILNQNASTVLRRIARLFDDLVTEPHIRRYYQYLLQYGEDDEMKGEFVIDARGSSALVERSLKDEAITQMAAVVTNPMFGLDPKKWAVEMLKSKRLEPSKFEYDDEDWRQLVEQMAQDMQTPDSRVEVAQLNNQTKERIAAMDAELKEAALALEYEKEQRKEVLSGASEQLAMDWNAAKAQLDAEIEGLRIDSEERKHLETMRTKMAETVMKLQAQFDMQEAGQAAELTSPPTEPAGRAPDGQAYAR